VKEDFIVSKQVYLSLFNSSNVAAVTQQLLGHKCIKVY